jgi:hypothetical protein
MIQNKLLKLKKDTEVAKDMPLKAGQEISIVIDVVYINGNMVPPSMQPMFYKWIENNPTLFNDITGTR